MNATTLLFTFTYCYFMNYSIGELFFVKNLLKIKCILRAVQTANYFFSVRIPSLNLKNVDSLSES